MLDALPTMLNPTTSSGATSAAPAARAAAEPGSGFAAEMQRQVDSQQADQRALAQPSTAQREAGPGKAVPPKAGALAQALARAPGQPAATAIAPATPTTVAEATAAATAAASVALAEAAAPNRSEADAAAGDAATTLAAAPGEAAVAWRASANGQRNTGTTAAMWPGAAPASATTRKGATGSEPGRATAHATTRPHTPAGAPGAAATTTADSRDAAPDDTLGQATDAGNPLGDASAAIATPALPADPGGLPFWLQAQALINQAALPATPANAPGLPPASASASVSTIARATDSAGNIVAAEAAATATAAATSGVTEPGSDWAPATRHRPTAAAAHDAMAHAVEHPAADLAPTPTQAASRLRPEHPAVAATEGGAEPVAAAPSAQTPGRTAAAATAAAPKTRRAPATEGTAEPRAKAGARGESSRATLPPTEVADRPATITRMAATGATTATVSTTATATTAAAEPPAPAAAHATSRPARAEAEPATETPPTDALPTGTPTRAADLQRAGAVGPGLPAAAAQDGEHPVDANAQAQRSAVAPVDARGATAPDAGLSVVASRWAAAAAGRSEDGVRRSGNDRAPAVDEGGSSTGAQRSTAADTAAHPASPPVSAVALAAAPRSDSLPTGREEARRADDTALGAPGATTTASTPLAAGGPAASTASSATGSAGSATTTVVEARIAVPLDSPGFGSALGTQVTLFARDGVQTARLQLNPAEMGPITVQIALDGGAARVDFQAERAATRSALEASLPALAGALQDAGLTLTGGGVFQQSPGQQAPQDPHTPGRASAAADSNRTPERAAAAAAPVRTRSRGLVDLVA